MFNIRSALSKIVRSDRVLRHSIIFAITVLGLLILGFNFQEVSSEQTTKTNIPNWIKQVAEFWVNDQIDDAGFVDVIEYLVQQNIITIPYAEAPEGDTAVSIPSWIKTNTEFWVKGNISDDEFAIGLEWLINNGIIRVQDVKERVVSAFKIEDNFYPIYQFTMTPSSPDCPDYHLHATYGYTVDSVRVSFTDHNPSKCGLGIVDSLIEHHITITEKQILEWEKVTEIKIPEE